MGAASLLVVALAGSAGAGSGGGLDPSFHGDGKVTTDLGASDSAADVVVQPDGKVVAVGTQSRFSEELSPPNLTSNFALARYNADGTLDTGFGAGGRAVTESDVDDDVALAAALQPDGRLVVAGLRGLNIRPPGDFALARYSSDGSLDLSFGAGGFVVTDFAGTHDVAWAVLVQGDGKLVAAGITYPPGSRLADFALARYNADGSLDRAFAVNGRAVTDFGGFELVNGAVLQPDGKIVVAGATGGELARNPKIAVARYNTDGTLDPTFDGDGRVVTDLPETDESAGSPAIQPDGKIVVLGGSGFGALRYTADGRLDTTFGGDGVVSTVPAPATPVDLALQPNGKIVALGYADGFVLARYLPDGRPDGSFGQGGIVTTDLDAEAFAWGLALQRDGKIVAAGSVGTPDRFDLDFALARYLAGTCSVPNVRGRTLSTARARLAAGNCRLGRVRKTFSKRVKKNRVVSQTPAPGREAADWALVNLVISRGRR